MPGRANETPSRGLTPRHSTPRRLNKAEAVALLDGYDTSPQGALTVALRIVLGRPDATWAELLAHEALADRRGELASGDRTAMDDLAAELNELRTLA